MFTIKSLRHLGRYKQLICCLAINISLAGIFTLAPAAFQTASAQALEEVVVTARKREESLQDTPIAVSAFSAESLADRQIDSLGTLDTTVPNLVFDAGEAIGGSSAAASVFIRGIGQTDFNQNTEPGVGIYVDGVYIARSVGSALDLIDLQQIEVLRGPQGTLFGRNTIGGAISLTTKKPSEELEGYATVTLGTDSLTQIKGTINVPLSDQVLSKFTIFSKQRDGYVIRTDGTDLGDDDVRGFRADFRFLPSDSLTIDLAVEKLRERENGSPAVLVEVNENAPFAQFNNFALNAAECPPPGPTPASPNCFNSQFITGDIRTDRGTAPIRSDLDIEGASLTIEWGIGDIEIKSITAYRELDSLFSTDKDHSPLVIDHTSNDYVQDQLSQELQITGSGDSLNWLLGFYYFEEDGTDVNEVDFSIGGLTSGGSIENEAYSVFGQLTYDFTEALSITAGVRQTEEDKLFIPNQFFRTDFVTPTGVIPAGAPLVLPGAEGELDISETNYLVSLGYSFNESSLAYMSYSDGFKSGGFTQRLAGALFVEPPGFEPEFVDVIEVGLKTQLFDDRVRLNLAYFNTQYDDIQLNVITPGLPNPFTINAAEATIDGFELELTALPTDALEVNVAMGYLDTGFDSAGGGITLQTFDPVGGVVVPIPVGIGLVDTSSSFVNSPEYTFSLGVSYVFETASGTVTPRLDWFYRDDVFNDAVNTASLFQPSYDVLNLGISYLDNDENWSLRAGITNVTDEEYLTTGFADLGAVGFSEGIYARGRETTIQATWNF